MDGDRGVDTQVLVTLFNLLHQNLQVVCHLCRSCHTPLLINHRHYPRSSASVMSSPPPTPRLIVVTSPILLTYPLYETWTWSLCWSATILLGHKYWVTYQWFWVRSPRSSMVLQLSQFLFTLSTEVVQIFWPKMTYLRLRAPRFFITHSAISFPESVAI